MKARQKGKQNKKFEFIFQTQKDILKWFNEFRKKQVVLPYEFQKILADNISDLYITDDPVQELAKQAQELDMGY